jgi:hypothetical protein
MMVLYVDTHSFSILVTDATYVIFGIINDLANLILSTIVMFLFFQEFIIFFDIKSCFFILSFVHSRNEISIALNIIETFGSFSGLMLNRNKTEGMWIGCITHCKDKIENINWVTYYVKYLGIYFAHNKAWIPSRLLSCLILQARISTVILLCFILTEL